MRRQSCRFAALGALALVAFAGAARAQGVDEFGSYGPNRGHRVTQSSQTAALEIRVGRYVPRIDDEFSGATPYKDTFGTKNRYSVGLELDWQAFRIPYLGTLGPGFGLEYTKISGPSYLARDLSQRASEDSSLLILPLYAVAVLRADYLARETPIPLAAYGKVGIGSALWWASGGDGTSRANGVAGRGFSYGPQFALGGMFLLDSLDQASAANMDDTLGVNNSYVFFEWYVSYLNGFGSGGQMQVGTNTWVLGLALEM